MLQFNHYQHRAVLLPAKGVPPRYPSSRIKHKTCTWYTLNPSRPTRPLSSWHRSNCQRVEQSAYPGYGSCVNDSQSPTFTFIGSKLSDAGGGEYFIFRPRWHLFLWSFRPGLVALFSFLALAQRPPTKRRCC